MNGPAHLEDRQQERDDHEADQRADDQDQYWREQRDERLGAGAHVTFFDRCDF